MGAWRIGLTAATATIALIVLMACGGGAGSSSAPLPMNTPLTATLTAPTDLIAGLTGTVALNATIGGGTAAPSAEFQVDGVPIGSAVAAAPYTVNVDTAAYAAGQHVVRVRARDSAGNVADWSSATVQFGGARTQPAGFTRSTLVSSLAKATAIAQARDGRLFVTEQGGTLRVVKNGALLGPPFVTLAVDSSSERGLLGVALHPNFASNGFVYLYYTTAQGGTHNRISRFTASAVNPDVAAAGSELPIADLPALGAGNHNGGAMHFGADDKLYVGVGENAVPANSQDLTTPLGKLLRLNDDGGIPGDNPFCSTPGLLRCAVWAMGLRNPFTFAVRASDGRIHINDVGQSSWEEINLGAAGANYGWPNSEGPTTSVGVTAPIFAYDHDASSAAGAGGFFSGCAIIGGAFYPDAGPFPAAYRGSYFFADLCSALIGRLDPANGNAAYSFGSVVGAPVGMLVGLDGALQVLTQTTIVRFTSP